MMTDRPARHYGLRRPGPGRRGLARRPGGLRPGHGRPAGRPSWWHDLPGGGERLVAGSVGIDHVLVAGDEVVADGVVDRGPARAGAAVGARTPRR